MTLSRTAGYAISALAFLAGQPGDRLCGLREIAEHEEIPAGFLSKILYALKRGGLLQAIRGIGGGYRLALPPDRISLISILEILGEKPEIEQCVLRVQHCGVENRCHLHRRFAPLREEFLSLLQTTTVADFLEAPTVNPRQRSDRIRRVLA